MHFNGDFVHVRKCNRKVMCDKPYDYGDFISPQVYSNLMQKIYIKVLNISIKPII